MSNRKFYALLGVVLILGIVGSLVFSSNSGLKKEIEMEQAGIELNTQFVDKFFNYASTKQRYDNVKSLMTERGYRSTYPSGMELPADSSVKSQVSNLKIYVQKAPSVKENQMEILNQFVATTEFNEIQSSKEVIMKTFLVYEESVGWMINDIEMIIQNAEE
ncbi:MULTISPECIES: hypothetical protein [unclassified Paenibacillus]|uniref:DUF4878 domain-containing protein n=1 Tax=Paenibacillus provencensis TaxID=441151 RepID=A0ABW3PYV8_9BACL|nr:MULTISPECIES: hypothetical protein [unclassified Paenibacillus]MCM3130199.1 hypothetical protein [Paenibacillus sp. MER 78]SDX71560.1 hypothetical protein SAMN05518848_11291 [Paenibacillus sp. PDC88]SFS88787.1 hypothetical protein SAMN04488601_10687 [Paenibacillus sp. 453mf]